jgi:hypothetical protein
MVSVMRLKTCTVAVCVLLGTKWILRILEQTYENICAQLRLQYEMEKEAEALEAEWKKGLPDDCEPLPYEEYAYLETA